MSISFKECHSFDERKKISEKIKDKIPIVVENADCKIFCVPLKFFCEKEILIERLVVHIRDRLKLEDSETLFLYNENLFLLDTKANLGSIYEMYKSDDNLLYLKYSKFRKSLQIGQKLVNIDKDKCFNVARINWFYRKDFRTIYLDDFVMYRLEGNSIRDFKFYSEIKDVFVYNNDLTIEYKDGTSDLFCAYLNIIHLLCTEIKKRII